MAPPRSQLSREELAVGQQMRFYRMRCRFSQAEFAEMTGTTRATISNIEYGTAKVPFPVGYELCRRQNKSLSWLAGGRPGPFVDPHELGIDEQTFRTLMRRGVSFLEGYNSAIREAEDRWFRNTGQIEIIGRMIKWSPEEKARSMSLEGLMESIPEVVDGFVRTVDDATRHEFAEVAIAQLTEVKLRLEAANPELRMAKPPPQGDKGAD